jgi:hypothetical protein
VVSSSGSPSGSGLASASPSAADESQAGSSATAQAPPNLTIPDIEVGDYLEVTADGLAVRAGPGTQHALISEYLLGRRDPNTTTLLREEVRLEVGHVVRADLGPLVVDGTAWFAVSNVPQAGQADFETPIWRSVAPVPYSEIDFQLTWIAVAQPGAAFVRVTERPACSPCYGDAPPPTAVAMGQGRGRIGPWVNRDVAFITFAVAAPSSATTCRIRVTNPAGETKFFDEPAVDYREAFIPGVSPAPDAGADADVWLDIAGDCAWAVKVQVAQD